MKIHDTRNAAVIVAGCLLLSGFVFYARSEASGQGTNPKSNNFEIKKPAGSVTVNGESQTIYDDEPFSLSRQSSNGSTQVDVSIESHSSGSRTSSRQTNIEIHTDSTTETQTTYQSAHHTDE